MVFFCLSLWRRARCDGAQRPTNGVPNTTEDRFHTQLRLLYDIYVYFMRIFLLIHQRL